MTSGNGLNVEVEKLGLSSSRRIVWVSARVRSTEYSRATEGSEWSLSSRAGATEVENKESGTSKNWR